MDGNNRWSKKNNFSNYDSYNFGAEKLIKLSNYLFSNYELSFISAFALSRNNLNRSNSVLKTIKRVLYYSLLSLEKKNIEFDINFIGSFDFLDLKTKNKINQVNKKNRFKKKLIIYINYGGREDIQQAVFKSKDKNIAFKNKLLTKNIPDPDILIRTGGYQRISNFLLYQIAFTELFFFRKLWPDLQYSDLKKVIENFYKIERKFGK